MRHEGKLESFALNALMIAAVGYIGYQAVKALLNKLKEKSDELTKPAGDKIADWLMPPPITVIGKYVLQDSGALLNPASYPVTWLDSNDPRAMPYDGQLPTINVSGRVYVLGPHDERGNYPAVRL